MREDLESVMEMMDRAWEEYRTGEVDGLIYLDFDVGMGFRMYFRQDGSLLGLDGPETYWDTLPT